MGEKMINGVNRYTLGNLLRGIRETKNLTQSDVKKLVGISEATLRRIENGENLPSLATIESLTNAYKVDILKIYTDLRAVNAYEVFYEKLDDLIINNDVHKLQEVYSSFTKFIKENHEEYFDLKEQEQYKLVLKGLETYFKDRSNVKEANEYYLKALKLRFEEYDLKNYMKYDYNHIELKALYILALNYCDEEKYHESNEILEFIADLEIGDIAKCFSSDKYKLLIKALLNISYNHFCLNELEKSLIYADRGLEKCLEIKSYYLMYALFYRKATALLKLGKEESEYIPYYQKSFMLLEIQGSEDLLVKYKQITKERYGIDL